MKPTLDQLAAAVLLARTERTKAAERRCCGDVSDESECVRLDDESEAARSRLEAAYRGHFDEWMNQRHELQQAAHAAHEVIEERVAKARANLGAG